MSDSYCVVLCWYRFFDWLIPFPPQYIQKVILKMHGAIIVLVYLDVPSWANNINQEWLLTKFWEEYTRRKGTKWEMNAECYERPYVVDTIGFWRWCITRRETGFSDFVHRPDSKLLKTQRFGDWICFRPQVREDTYSVGSLRKSYPQSLDQWVYWSSGGTHCLCLQGRKVTETNNQQETSSKEFRLLSEPEDISSIFFRNIGEGLEDHMATYTL
jgi:hypothetical protein